MTDWLYHWTMRQNKPIFHRLSLSRHYTIATWKATNRKSVPGVGLLLLLTIVWSLGLGTGLQVKCRGVWDFVLEKPLNALNRAQWDVRRQKAQRNVASTGLAPECQRRARILLGVGLGDILTTSWQRTWPYSLYVLITCMRMNERATNSHLMVI